MKITRRRVAAMPLHEKVRAYWKSHEVYSRRGTGTNYIAQVNFWDNWREALAAWEASLD